MDKRAAAPEPPQAWVCCPEEKQGEARAAFARAKIPAEIAPPSANPPQAPGPVLQVDAAALPGETRAQLREAGATSAVDWLERRTGYTEFDLFGEEELKGLFARAEARYRRWYWLKRAVDVLLVSVAAALTLPLLPLIAAMIRLDSKGPVFFLQQRIGRNNKAFALRKFRTMTHEPQGSLYTSSGDRRITRAGALLRRFHLDELPQLWNVLAGHMTLVGPRPEVEENMEHHLRQLIRMYDKRHIAAPGITGWAQTQYGYPSAPQHFLYRHRYDLFYLRNYSPLLDLRILVETAARVLIRRMPSRPPRHLPALPPGLRAEARSTPGQVSLWVDVENQRLVLYKGSVPKRSYAVSTAANGLSNADGSYGTPSGLHRISERLGEGSPKGTEFVGRKPSGRKVRPGELPTSEDCITTRILWLEGATPENSGNGCDSKDRYIYIHGSPHTRTLGLPVSGGCVRMSDEDVTELFKGVSEGTPVLIH